MIVVLIVSIILLIFLIKFIHSNYHLRYDSITFFEGCLGSGKTTIITRLAINERRRRIIYNYFVPFLKIALWLIPIYNVIRLLQKKENRLQVKKRGIDVYSNYPIKLNRREWSIAINKDLLSWIYRVNEDCIIVLDEVGYLFPNEQKKTEDIYTFCLTWMRHGTNALMFCASQSLSECNVTFRRKVNRCYHLANIRRCLLPFFSKVQIVESIVSEDINTITMDTPETRQENWYRFKYPVTHFRSRYGKNYYKLDDVAIHQLAINYQKTFEKMRLTNGSRWSSYYYEFDKFS